MRGLLQTFVLLAACVSLRGGVFEDANRRYEQGKYAEAISLYQRLLRSGHYTPGVLFNLGNACFKNGEIGRAIYYYRRVQQVAPRDPDVQANLRFARDRVSGGASVQPTAFQRLLGYLTLNELATAATLLFWIWIGLLCYQRWKPSARGSLRPYVATCAILFIAAEILLVASYRQAQNQSAIITEHQAIARLGPLEESQQAFAVPDGTELRVLARREDWLQVTDRSGRIGWLNARHAAIFP